MPPSYQQLCLPVFVNYCRFSYRTFLRLSSPPRYSTELKVQLKYIPRWTRVRAVNDTPRPLYPQKEDPVPIVQDNGWVPRPVWTGARNSPTPEFEPRTYPTRSEPLYQLSFPRPFGIHHAEHLHSSTSVKLKTEQ